LSRQAARAIGAAADVLPEALAARVKRAAVGEVPRRARRLEIRDKLAGTQDR
jgi:hypothetical protein